MCTSCNFTTISFTYFYDHQVNIDEVREEVRETYKTYSCEI